MKISKELLGEVLEEDVRLGIYTTVESDEDELVQHIMKIEIYGNRVSYWKYYKEWDDGSTMVRCQININELAFKCKEWASELDYEMESATYRYNKGGYCFASTFLNNTRFEAKTEVEAIIKACEYILKEINEKQLQH